MDVNHYGLHAIAQCSIYLLPGIALLCFAGTGNEPRRSWLGWVVGPMLLLSILPMAVCYVGAATGQVPLAHYRFSIASATLLILTSGFLLGMNGSHSRKVWAVLLTCGLAGLTHPLLASWVTTGQWPQQRNESWQSVIQRMGSDNDPVVFCPNLVEDFRESSGPDSPLYREYYSFALRGWLAVHRPGESRTILAVPIRRGRAQLSQGQLDRLLASEKPFWLLVRGWPDQSEGVAERLLESLSQLRDDREVQVQKRQAGTLSLFQFQVSRRQQ